LHSEHVRSSVTRRFRLNGFLCSAVGVEVDVVDDDDEEDEEDEELLPSVGDAGVEEGGDDEELGYPAVAQCAC
jgi:D-aminopeptidase